MLPILYFSIKFSQILNSGEDLRKTVGVDGLAGDAVFEVYFGFRVVN